MCSGAKGVKKLPSWLSRVRRGYIGVERLVTLMNPLWGKWAGQRKSRKEVLQAVRHARS